MDKSKGLRVREDAIAGLTGPVVRHALKALAGDNPALVMKGILSDESLGLILADLEAETGWKEECWKLDASEQVEPVSSPEFETCSPNLRFSRNYCLRKPASESWCLRGLLSAIVSEEVRASLSSAFGKDVKFRSADIARYERQHYLRRHADLFEDRRFGLVWFFNPGWRRNFGGELVVESITGAAVVVPPVAGSVALLPIRPGYFHQVAVIRTNGWSRYSMATHFHEVPTELGSQLRPGEGSPN